MDRVEQLVSILYSPGADHAALEQAQRELQIVQKSPRGWEFAGLMLASPSAQTQFLGAQTFLVKLHQGTDLPPVPDQRQQLLAWLGRAVAAGSPAFVVRKLLSVVAKMYLHSSDWSDGVVGVVQTVGAGSALCFDFVDTLVEDSELAPGDLRAKLVPAVSQVVLELLGGGRLADARALKTLEVWATAFFDQFKTLMHDLVMLMLQTFAVDEGADIFVATCRCIENLYSYESRSWPAQTQLELSRALESLASTYSAVPPPDFADDERFLALAALAMTFSNEDFSRTSLHPFIAQIAAANAPVVDDPLATECIGFWNQYTEEVISSGLSSDANPVIASVISNYWPRIRIYDGLRNSDWEEFASFRTEFADFLELAYPLIGSELFSHLADLVLISLDAMDWYGIESAMYCLNALSDIIGDDYRGERPELSQVQRIFQSDLWPKLPHCDNFRVKQTAVNLIGCFVDFFASNDGHSYLAVTLNYLFTSLRDKPLQNTASRSIQKLCDTCRSLLVAETGAFIAVYAQIRSELLDVPHLRTVSGIAYVIQAQTDLVEKVQALDKLLDLILTTQFDGVPTEEARQQQLKCVAAVGKGIKDIDNMQQPATAVPNNALASPPVVEFWHSNEVAIRIRGKLQEIINYALEATDITTVEAICDIVKAGMSEDSGPFVLDENVVISFVVSKFQAGPEQVLSPILDLAKFYVMSCRAALKSHKTGAVSPDSMAQLMRMLDQDISVQALSAALDLLTQLVLLAQSAQGVLLDLGPPGAMRHAYLGLSVSDRFVTKSSTSFWKEFLPLNPLTVDQATPLVRILVQQISSQATRSELGAFVDILKSLIAKHPMIVAPLLKKMIVTDPETPNLQRLELKPRSDFVAQLLLLKGGRRTFDIVQKFWLLCRNIPDTYDPAVQVIA